MNEVETHVLEDLHGTEGLEKAERASTTGVINLHVDYGVHDGALSSELLTALGRWDGTLYQNLDSYPRDVDYRFVIQA